MAFVVKGDLPNGGWEVRTLATAFEALITAQAIGAVGVVTSIMRDGQPISFEDLRDLADLEHQSESQ